MAATTWTFGSNGDYTASWDGAQTVIVTVTATGAFVTSAALTANAVLAVNQLVDERLVTVCKT